MKIEMTRAQLGEAATKWVVDRIRLADGDHELEVRIHEKGGGATVTIPDAVEFAADPIFSLTDAGKAEVAGLKDEA